MEDFMQQGMSAYKEDVEYDESELSKGIEVELEHTDDIKIAEKIAKDHLCEIPDYYTRLEKMEEEAKEEGMVDEEFAKRYKEEQKKRMKIVKNKTYRYREESPVSIEKRVSPSEFRQVYKDYDSTISLAPDRFYQSYGRLCIKCNMEMVKDKNKYWCIWCNYSEPCISNLICPECKSKNIDQVSGIYKCLDCGCSFRYDNDKAIVIDSTSYYNPDKDVEIGDRSSFPGNLFLNTPNPDIQWDRQPYTRVVEDY